MQDFFTQPQQNFWNSVNLDQQVPNDFLDEPPLLEELGLNFDHIKRKTIAVLNPAARTLDPEILEDCDFAGPIVFGLCLGLSLSLTGKWAFDYIYGFGSIGSISIYLLVNLMTPSGFGINIYRTVSILGYCLLPMVLLAIVSIVMTLTNSLGAILVGLCVLWCTSCSSLMFSVPHSEDQRFLFAYPLALYYTCFALLTIF